MPEIGARKIVNDKAANIEFGAQEAMLDQFANAAADSSRPIHDVVCIDLQDTRARGRAFSINEGEFGVSTAKLHVIDATCIAHDSVIGAMIRGVSESKRAESFVTALGQRISFVYKPFGEEIIVPSITFAHLGDGSVDVEKTLCRVSSTLDSKESHRSNQRALREALAITAIGNAKVANSDVPIGELANIATERIADIVMGRRNGSPLQSVGANAFHRPMRRPDDFVNLHIINAEETEDYKSLLSIGGEYSVEEALVIDAAIRVLKGTIEMDELEKIRSKVLDAFLDVTPKLAAPIAHYAGLRDSDSEPEAIGDSVIEKVQDIMRPMAQKAGSSLAELRMLQNEHKAFKD